MLISLLVGCPWVSPNTFDELRDIDEDGVTDERFEGRDCDPSNPNVGDCDADADGFRAAPFGPDCDDADPLVHPERPELCNGIDDDCDGVTDDEASIAPEALTVFYVDDDRDGFGAEPVMACAVRPGTVDRDGDCDDDDPDIHPGAPERCDLADRDCDGEPQDDAVDATDWYADDDGDGFGGGPVLATSCTPPAGTGAAGDCDDGDPAVHPDAVEVCNLVDDNCNGLTDDDDGGVVAARTWGLDRDEDGYIGLGTERRQCANPSNGVSVYLLDAEIDCDDDDPSVQESRSWYRDLDNDGFGDPGSESVQCLRPVDGVRLGTDCDDENASVNPSSPEVCNDIDDNCDGRVDDGTIGLAWLEDADGDGFGDATMPPQVQCAAPGPSSVLIGGDCDDTDAAVNPARLERCSGVDDDCDGAIDDDDDSVLPGRVYLDVDGDGYGVSDVVLALCEPPVGFALVDGDCDDGDASVHRSVSVFPDPELAAAGPTLQTLVDTTCDGGTVLLGEVEFEQPIELPSRHISMVGAPSGGVVTVPAGPDLLPDDLQFGNLFNVPPGGVLSLRNLEVVGEPELQSPPGRSYIRVAGTGRVELDEVFFHDLIAPNNLVHLETFATAVVRNVDHEDITVGNRGLYRMDSRASLEISDATFARIESRVGNPTDLAVLAHVVLPQHFLVDGVDVRESALQSGTTLFKVSLYSGQYPAARFEDMTVQDAGRILHADGHPVEMVRQRWVDVARQDPGPDDQHRYSETDPCVFEESDPDEGGPLTALDRPLADRDVVTAHDGAVVTLRNSEIIGSGSLCTDGGATRVEVQSSVVADPIRSVARGWGSTSCDAGGTVVQSVSVSFVDSVLMATSPTQSALVEHVEPLTNVSTEAALSGWTNSAATPLVTAPVIADSPTCSTVGAADIQSIDDLGFVSPKDAATLTSRQDWLLHAIRPGCPDTSSQLTVAGRGTLVGPDADLTWLLDSDGDGMAEAWELYWFGTTETCSDVDAYWSGTPPTAAPPTCDPSLPVEPCP